MKQKLHIPHFKHIMQKKHASGGKMTKEPHLKLIDVNLENLNKTGFFCYMSKKKSPGYQRKLAWTKERLAEGMKIKIIKEGSRGFIEYIPGEYAWRSVQAKGYMFIHCLWIVGKKNHGKGHGSFLLNHCEQEAKKAGMHGVVTLCTNRVWAANSKIYYKNGFESVDETDDGFQLMAKKFDDHKDPKFCGGWKKKCSAHPQGLTIFRSDQCPYIDDAVNTAITSAKQHKLKYQIVDLTDSKQVRKNCPSPYGTFSLILDGELMSYHYLMAKDFDKRLLELKQE